MVAAERTRRMMDPTGLAFDLDGYLETLHRWVSCQSPTHDCQAVNRMMDQAARELMLMGAQVQRIPGRMGFGDCVKGVLPHARAGEPGVLVMGHVDTVHPVGTLSKLSWRREGDRLYGPGVCDMKGGNVLALTALGMLARAGVATGLPVTVLFTSDEEVGSPSTRDLIEAEAARHRYVLVPEPGGPDGAVTTGRYAIARFNLVTTGRPSHAGSTLAEGRSAIRSMAQRLIEIEDMTTADCTFSVGVIRGGDWVNCVATTCSAEALSMAKRQADLDQGVARMLALSGVTNDVSFQVTRGVTRPVWEPDAGTMALYERAQAIAAGLGMALPHRSAGGGSDGNFTGAMGVPTLDGLGVLGAGVHTLGEHLLVSSVEPRARLLAGLLTSLA